MQETFKNVVGTFLVNQEIEIVSTAQSQAIRGNTVKYSVCQNVDYNLINSVQ